MTFLPGEGADVARIDPLPPRSWPPEMRTALAAMAPANARHPRPVSEGRPKALNTLGTFAHHPELAHAFLTFNGHVLGATTLSPRQREILVLRVAAVRRCAYEWAQHVAIARDAGLDDGEIARIAYGADAPFWGALDAALLRSVDELLDEGAIGEATWAVLAAELDARQLLDVVFTVGAYATVAMMMRSFDLELDDDLSPA
jgi:AhpD family alkylhydroperoxidase